jgi:O-antigen/teichoic acid export membrane protein
MKIDIIMIGMYLGNAEAGIYSASSRPISIILLFTSSFFLFIYPNQSRISTLTNKFLKFYRSLILFSFLIGLTIFLGAIFFGKFYLKIFGENFSSSYGILVILSFNIFFALILKLWVQKEFIKTGYFIIFLLQTFTILINIFLNIYLIPLYGSLGAAYATVLSGIIAFLIINIFRINEFYLLAGAFSLSSFKITAKEIFRIILEKKKPENIENIKE